MEDTVGAFVAHSPPPMKGADHGPLEGLSFAVKDLYDFAGYVSGGGNPVWLETHEPAAATSSIVQRLQDAGADMVGKTVCDELFFSFFGSNAHYGTPVNVRAPGRVAGGSSCGSAAAVAAGLCDFSLGSDTGGSVRVPASFCGLYGLRPTHGRLSLDNAMAMAPSFDTCGWFANDAETYHRVGRVLFGFERAERKVERLLIADFALDWSDPEIALPLRRYLERIDLDIPVEKAPPAAFEGLDLLEASDSFRIIQGFETWATFGAWIEEHRPQFGPGVKERLQMASEITAEQRDQAQIYRDRVRDCFDRLLTPGTVLALPTTASAPPTVDLDPDAQIAFRAKTMALICLASQTGLPALNIPAAKGPGYPIGLSLMGWRGGDEGLLDLMLDLAPFCKKF